MKFALGTDDFKELRDNGAYFVDKSMLIADIVSSNKITLIPRPRRFGKTLNMSMLRYFFDCNQPEDQSYLFDGLKIKNTDCFKAHFAGYPVIYLSLKDIKGNCWEDAYSGLSRKMSDLYITHSEILDQLSLKIHSDYFLRVRDLQASTSELYDSLKNLISHLHAHHGKPVIVLIDEYDSPVIEARNKGYQREMLDFMRAWLGSALKHDNGLALFKSVVTGILRIAKESIFSGLNNLYVSPMNIDNQFSDKFGFTESEVETALMAVGQRDTLEEIKEWYNGYKFGSHTIYNPWSVISCITDYPNPIGPKWLNTSSNTLVYEELENGGIELKRDMETLLQGRELRYPIHDNIILDDIGHDPVNIWSFLFFSGYLRVENPERSIRNRTILTYAISIPNLEISMAFEAFIRRFFTQNRCTPGDIEAFLDCFCEVDQLPFLEERLGEIAMNILSYHYTAKKEEIVFHAFVLGLLAGLRDLFDIQSNPETGYGRADITMIPKHKAYPRGFVIEFKNIRENKKKTIEEALDEGLRQIEEKQYAARLIEAGTPPEHITRIAIAVKGKKVQCKINDSSSNTDKDKKTL